MTNQSVLQLVENLFNIMNHLGDAMAGKNNITGLQLSLVTMEINTQASCNIQLPWSSGLSVICRLVFSSSQNKM